MADRFSDEHRSPPDVKEDWRRTIYCGGLRYETKEDAVKQFFEDEYGPVVSVKVGLGVGKTWRAAPAVPTPALP